MKTIMNEILALILILSLTGCSKKTNKEDLIPKNDHLPMEKKLKSVVENFGLDQEACLFSNQMIDYFYYYIEKNPLAEFTVSEMMEGYATNYALEDTQNVINNLNVVKPEGVGLLYWVDYFEEDDTYHYAIYVEKDGQDSNVMIGSYETAGEWQYITIDSPAQNDVISDDDFYQLAYGIYAGYTSSVENKEDMKEIFEDLKNADIVFGEEYVTGLAYYTDTNEEYIAILPYDKELYQG